MRRSSRQLRNTFFEIGRKKSKVIALEPFDDSFNTLKNRLTNLKKENITIIKKGIWSNTEKIYLKTTSNSLGCTIVTKEEYAASAEKTEFTKIDSITIDELVNELNLKKVDLIKMDIEGAEIEALEGSKKTMEELCPIFAIASYHKRNNVQTFHKVESFFHNNGYKAYTFLSRHLTTCGEKITN